MSARRRELELLLLTAFAAVPLYFTEAVGVFPVALFHAAMIGMIVRVASGRTPELLPERVMRGVAIAYVPFYIVDAVINHAIAGSAHLVLFIAAYQPIDGTGRGKRAQRLLTAALIFTASLATSTHISIVIFVIVFSLVMLRQLILLSQEETAESIARAYDEPLPAKAAIFYLCATTVLAAALFPLLPRVRNPIVHGLTGALTNATTGLSNSIDFNENRTSNPDPSVVARVWMGQEAVPFFTPLRLRANVYDRYFANEWEQSKVGFRDLRQVNGAFQIARPLGFTRLAHVQQRLVTRTKLFLPTGTYAVSGLPVVVEGPAHDVYLTSDPGTTVMTYDVSMAMDVEPLRRRVASPTVVNYPLTPPVVALARSIAGTQATPRDQARAVERYMLTHFKYLQRPEQIGHRMTVDEFLLRERRGHCEYFAAGMVALMSSLGVPSRIVGGFYGGRLNPLTGYFVVRREDAHAWVEVWEGTRWGTYDPTPPSMRPGNTQDGLLRTYANAIGDSINYFWDRYILTYGLGDQIALALQALASATATLAVLRARVAAAGHAVTLSGVRDAAAVLVALIVFILLIRRSRRSIFDALARRLALLGIEIGPAMTMEEALTILRAERPEAARELAPLIDLYEAERFSATRDRTRVARLRRGLAALRG